MRLAAVGLAILAVALVVVAVTGLIDATHDAGDPGTVETALTGETTAPSTTTTIEDTPTSRRGEPLWIANETSLLADTVETAEPRPQRLVIEAIDVDAPIGEYGVDANGQMDVPDNTTEVGWYKYGPSPGEPGSAVLAAHVDLSGPGKGLFYDLGEMEEGDSVLVGFSDGSFEDFRVVARSTYLKTELPLDAIFSRRGDPVLTLVTCGGGFNESSRHYDSNVVVFAVPVDDDAGPSTS